MRDPFYAPQAALHNGGGRILHQTNGGGAAAAFEGGSLGVGFSGSGFLIMYFVGVTAVLRNLGIIDSDTKLAGSSGGAAVSALSCGGVSIDAAVGTFSTMSSLCRGSADCRYTLKAVEMAGMANMFPGDAHSRCSGRLFVSFTEARPNPEPDVGRVISSFPTKNSLVQALLASTYIPAFSGRSTVMSPSELGVAAAYDGVCTNPLPAPPGVSHVITVSALAGSTPPDFSQLAADANANPDPSSAAYLPLDPVVQAQPSRIDIYPGLSGPLKISTDSWNSYTLHAPDSGMLQLMYDQGRQDAAAYVSANIPSRAGQTGDALTATARDVTSVPMQISLENALSTADTVLSGGVLGDVLGTVANAATGGGGGVSVGINLPFGK